MLTLGSTLFLIGAIICMGAVIFVVVNMGRALNDSVGMFDMGETTRKKKGDFSRFIVGHVGALITLTLGVLLSIVGIVLIVASFAQILAQKLLG